MTRSLRQLMRAAVLALIFLWVCGHALAGNGGLEVGKIQPSTIDSVIVVSRIIAAGSTNEIIGIRITNAVAIMGLSVPLELRAVTPGAFVTRVALGYRERLEDELTGVRFANHYPEKDFECPDSKTQGYREIVASESGWRVPVTKSQWGVMFSAFRFPPKTSLAPGTDSIGSLTLTVDVTSASGTFEIDTACTYPSNHLMLVAERAASKLSGVSPVFVKGVITIGACQCVLHGDINGDGTIDALDYSRVIDHVFFGGATPPKDAPCPHVNRGDINCDGAVDIRDVLHLREHMYGSGIPACAPCACDPYPQNCP